MYLMGDSCKFGMGVRGINWCGVGCVFVISHDCWCLDCVNSGSVQSEYVFEIVEIVDTVVLRNEVFIAVVIVVHTVVSLCRCHYY